MTVQLTFDDVTFGYDRHPAVHHLSGEIAQGELLAVVGPNGAGKSTLLRGVVSQVKPLCGTITRRGAARDTAYLPQVNDIDRHFPISVFDFVGMGLLRSRGLFGGFGKSDVAKIESALVAVGLSGFENRAIVTLSGGQMQRMLFARVLLQDASMIVLDEPLNAIDSKTSADLVKLIAGWHAEGRTVIAALHDIELVRTVFPKTLLLARSVIAWGPTSQVLTPDNLHRAHHMCEAFDDEAAPCIEAKSPKAA